MTEIVGKQDRFFASAFGPDVEPSHGGASKAGQRKTSRPLEPTLPLYLVLRSSRARAAWSLKKPATDDKIRDLLGTLTQRHKVKLFEFVNGGDQLHLLLRAPSRPGFQAFLRSFAGLTARAVTGARKGKPAGKFWDGLTFSRVVAWGDEFDKLRNCFGRGDLDALAAISGAPPPKSKRATGRR